MRALTRDTSHTFMSYDRKGNRTVRRVGPLYRDKQTGRVRWDWAAAPFASERLDYQESWADGIPAWHPGAVRVADGTYRVAWDSHAIGGGGPTTPARGAPSPRELRQMVVDRARRDGELEVLSRALGIPPDAWVLEAPGD